MANLYAAFIERLFPIDQAVAEEISFFLFGGEVGWQVGNDWV